MDWLAQAAHWLRNLLAQQSWLKGWRTSIEATPDWALLAAGPTALVLFALILRWASRSERTLPPAERRPTFSPLQTAVPPDTPADKTETAAQYASAKRVGISARLIPSDDDNRAVRVFVSSTFLDMQRERDILVKEVFPKMRARMRARGVELFEIDLRWGITKEQQERGDTLPTLLSEIDRCRPYFIGLIGDRYGWTPPAEALTPELKATYPNLAEAAGMSVTAMEIVHGVLSDGDARALIFERDPNWDWAAALADEERATIEPESESARLKLATLKAALRGKGVAIKSYARPEEIGAAVENALGALLEERFPDAAAPDLFEQTLHLHRAYARERRGLHVGAASYRKALDHWMEDTESSPLLIAGESGTGKSTLIANWLHDWRAQHPNDIVFEHYLGASPDSADPEQIMLRLWEFLNRATGEAVEPPNGEAELMDVSATLAQRIAQALTFARRQSGRVLVALDGLDKLSSEQNLRWLPVVPGLNLVASSLDGDAKLAALARGWRELKIKALNQEERRTFVVETLKGWGRQLLQTQIDAILGHQKAGVPLFLKTVLGELRVAATHGRLEQVLRDYLGSADLPDLFARMIARLERDCEPGLVAMTLPIIWASRAGLEEAEIIAITSASPIAWATLRNGLGDNLCDHRGRVTLSHDYLKQAIALRYVQTDLQKRAVRLAIANHFDSREPDARQVEELPFQLRGAEEWERLEAVLVDLNRFDLFVERGNAELLSYWLPLKRRGRDPEALLCAAFESMRTRAAGKSFEQALMAMAALMFGFLRFAGARQTVHTVLHEHLSAGFSAWGDAEVSQMLRANALQARGDIGGAQKLLEQVLEMQLRTLGAEHPDTLATLHNLAATLSDRGDLNGAQMYQERVLEARTRLLGPEHPDTLTGINNLAKTLLARGDLHSAQKLQRQALEGQSRLLGPEHPDTLTSMNNLASTLGARGDLEGAQSLEESVLEARTRLLGPEHPDTLTSMNNLASTLRERGDLQGAQSLEERVLEARTRLLGPEHLHTLTSMNNLASTLSARGDLEGAQPLEERVLEARTRLLGSEHSDTLSSMNNLAATLHKRGNLERAQELFEKALATLTTVLGSEHPDTLTTANNLASTLGARGDLEGAQSLEERVLEARTRLLGSEHPDTLSSMNNLASTLQARGDFQSAQNLRERVLEARTRLLGPEHPDTLISMNNLAGTLRERGDFQAARNLHERVLEAQTRLLGPEHPATLTSMNNLAGIFAELGDLDEAQKLEECVLEARIRLLGPEHPSTLASMNNLALTLSNRGDIKGAQTYQERVLGAFTRTLGPEHPDTLTTMGNLAGTLRAQGNLEGAQSLEERVLDAYTQILGSEHPDTLSSMNNLASILQARGDFQSAQNLHERVLEARTRLLGPEHPETLTSMNNLAVSLRDMGRFSEAHSLFERALATRTRAFGENDQDTITTRASLARTLALIGRSDEALAQMRQVVTQRTALLGADHSDTKRARDYVSEWSNR